MLLRSATIRTIMMAFSTSLPERMISAKWAKWIRGIILHKPRKNIWLLLVCYPGYLLVNVVIGSMNPIAEWWTEVLEKGGPLVGIGPVSRCMSRTSAGLNRIKVILDMLFDSNTLGRLLGRWRWTMKGMSWIPVCQLTVLSAQRKYFRIKRTILTTGASAREASAILRA